MIRAKLQELSTKFQTSFNRQYSKTSRLTRLGIGALVLVWSLVLENWILATRPIAIGKLHLTSDDAGFSGGSCSERALFRRGILRGSCDSGGTMNSNTPGCHGAQG
jgi:hypothetical protein